MNSDHPKSIQNETSNERLHKSNGNITFTKSLFNHRPPTVFFDYPFSKKRQKSPRTCVVEKKGFRELTYSCSWERNCIKNAFNEAGFVRNKSKKLQCCDWIKPPPAGYFKKITKFNKVNHFPGSWCIGRKDRLLRCIQRAKRFASSSKVKEKDAYDFFPEGWILPQHYESWLKVAKMERNPIFILKPSASSRGRGIKLIHKGNVHTVSPKKVCIIQRYIKDPYLINGKKFDLRLYVLVTSFDPLRVYIFKEGLVRFSSLSYSISPKKLNCKFVHLTNFSINKKCESFTQPKEDDYNNINSDKCSLTALWRHLAQVEGENIVRKCKNEIEDVIIKSLIAAETEMTSTIKSHTRESRACFELFGVDVMIDKHFKAWLIEFNVAPSLMSSTPLDMNIKGYLITDILHLVGIVPKEKIEHDNLECNKENKLIKTEVLEHRKADFYESMINPELLSNSEWEMIYDLEDEYIRRGHFFRIFPSSRTSFLKLFQSQRISNKLMHAWLMVGRNSFRQSQEICLKGSERKKKILIEKAKKRSIVTSTKKHLFVPGYNCKHANRFLEPLEQWSESSNTDIEVNDVGISHEHIQNTTLNDMDLKFKVHS